VFFTARRHKGRSFRALRPAFLLSLFLDSLFDADQSRRFNSTRRFIARPAGVAFSVIGFAMP
jgi:hypothetical protein